MGLGSNNVQVGIDRYFVAVFATCLHMANYQEGSLGLSSIFFFHMDLTRIRSGTVANPAMQSMMSEADIMDDVELVL